MMKFHITSPPLPLVFLCLLVISYPVLLHPLFSSTPFLTVSESQSDAHPQHDFVSLAAINQQLSHAPTSVLVYLASTTILLIIVISNTFSLSASSGSSAYSKSTTTSSSSTQQQSRLANSGTGSGAVHGVHARGADSDSKTSAPGSHRPILYETIELAESNPHVGQRSVPYNNGKIRPTIPTGWYRLSATSDIKLEKVRFIRLLGQYLAVYRGSSGRIVVLDAYCPHLGANMAVGGFVDKDCLRCPFHGWTFDPSGQCVSIPYSDKIPKQARVRSWPTAEHERNLMLWFDFNRPESQPTWNFPAPPPQFDPTLDLAARMLLQVPLHIEDFASLLSTPEFYNTATTTAADFVNYGTETHPRHAKFARMCSTTSAGSYAAQHFAYFIEDYFFYCIMLSPALSVYHVVPIDPDAARTQKADITVSATPSKPTLLEVTIDIRASPQFSSEACNELADIMRAQFKEMQRHTHSELIGPAHAKLSRWLASFHPRGIPADELGTMCMAHDGKQNVNPLDW
jgi:nitrite reductase/ring-hydroxylating ferredoxin subunit